MTTRKTTSKVSAATSTAKNTAVPYFSATAVKTKAIAQSVAAAVITITVTNNKAALRCKKNKHIRLKAVRLLNPRCCISKARRQTSPPHSPPRCFCSLSPLSSAASSASSCSVVMCRSKLQPAQCGHAGGTSGKHRKTREITVFDLYLEKMSLC